MLTQQLGYGGLCVLAFLTLWFLISIPHQFTNGFGRRIKKLNIFGLIPGWTFFAPNPGISDYRFVFRDIFSEGHSEWKEVEWCRCRRLVDALWHPQRHRTKLIVDCVSAFVLTVQEMRKLGLATETEGDTPAWIVAVPYMALLNVTVSMPRASADVRARQFAIIEQKPSEPSGKPRLIVCSAPHEL